MKRFQIYLIRNDVEEEPYASSNVNQNNKMTRHNFQISILTISLLFSHNQIVKVTSISEKDNNASSNGDEDISVRKIGSKTFIDPNALLFPGEELYEKIVNENDPRISTGMDSTNNKDLLVDEKSNT